MYFIKRDISGSRKTCVTYEVSIQVKRSWQMSGVVLFCGTTVNEEVTNAITLAADIQQVIRSAHLQFTHFLLHPAYLCENGKSNSLLLLLLPVLLLLLFLVSV